MSKESRRREIKEANVKTEKKVEEPKEAKEAFYSEADLELKNRIDKIDKGMKNYSKKTKKWGDDLQKRVIELESEISILKSELKTLCNVCDKYEHRLRAEEESKGFVIGTMDDSEDDKESTTVETEDENKDKVEVADSEQFRVNGPCLTFVNVKNGIVTGTLSDEQLRELGI